MKNATKINLILNKILFLALLVFNNQLLAANIVPIGVWKGRLSGVDVERPIAIEINEGDEGVVASLSIDGCFDNLILEQHFTPYDANLAGKAIHFQSEFSNFDTFNILQNPDGSLIFAAYILSDVVEVYKLAPECQYGFMSARVHKANQ